jgi:S1-C subfamily serine protease
VILSVDGEDVSTLAELYRKVWSLGTAGVEVPMTLYREGLTFDVRVNSSDRAKFLRAPRLH